jgi:hypothetical protein
MEPVYRPVVGFHPYRGGQPGDGGPTASDCLSVYAAGLAIPFLVLSVFVDSLLTFIKKASWSIRYINVTAGVLLLILGLLLVTNKLNLISV